MSSHNVHREIIFTAQISLAILPFANELSALMLILYQVPSVTHQGRRVARIAHQSYCLSRR